MGLDALANIVTILSSLSVVFAIVQLIRATKEQNTEAFFYLHQYLSQDQFSVARKRVRTELYSKPYQEWTDEEKEFANKVCASYDQAGILIGSEIVDKKTKKKFLASSWGRSIIDQYESLKDFLDDKQTPTLTGREFFKHFTWLYEESKTVQGELNEQD